MKKLFVLVLCLALSLSAGFGCKTGTGSAPGGVTPSPTGPGGSSPVGEVGEPGVSGPGSGDTAAAGPEGVTPVEDHQDIEEYARYALKVVDDTVTSTNGGEALAISAGGKVVIKGLVEKLASIDGQIPFDGPYGMAPAGEKVLLVLFSDPSLGPSDYLACTTVLNEVEPVTAETPYEVAIKRRNLNVTFSGYDGWYVRLFAIGSADPAPIVDCQKKMSSASLALAELQPPDGYLLKTFPMMTLP